MGAFAWDGISPGTGGFDRGVLRVGMLSGTNGLVGDLSGIRGGDAAGVLGPEPRGVCAVGRVMVVSTCSSGTLPAKAAEAGLGSGVSNQCIKTQASWTYMS